MKTCHQPILLRNYVLIFLASFLLLSCNSSISAVPIPTAIYPGSSAPVQVTVLSSDQFTINNQTAVPIYYQVFPTDLLPLIDWAPCESDKTCLQIIILVSQSITLQFESVAGRDTQSISIYWWQRKSDDGQHNPEYLFPQLISFPVP